MGNTVVLGKRYKLDKTTGQIVERNVNRGALDFAGARRSKKEPGGARGNHV